LQQLVKVGFIQEIVELDWDPRLFGGGPNQVVLPVPWTLPQQDWNPDPWTFWADQHLREEVLPVQLKELSWHDTFTNLPV